MVPGHEQNCRVTGDAAPGIDLERYIDWFAWARETLGRELDATHAAAEAAYKSEAKGASEDEARADAQAAGGEAASLDPETMALAEWAAWARSAGGFDAPASALVARLALTEVQANHDLASTMSAVLFLSPRNSAAAKPARNSSNRNAWIAAAVVIGLLAIGGAAAGLSGLANQQSSTQPSPALKATINVTMLPTGDAEVSGTGLPPNDSVFIFIDGAFQKIASTDSNGSFVITIPFPPGGHNVAICLDDKQAQCPASEFVSGGQ